jgi:hypothetical protein
MPKTPINYENTSIYKIVCKDLNITDCYVGHTTDLVKRKNQHKRNSINPNSKSYHIKVYQFIRNNKGWDNFDTILVEKYPCDNVNEAKKRERYWIEQLKATLNMTIPLRNDEEYYQDNKEKIKQQVKEYIKNNPEKIKERNKNYMLKNKEKLKTRNKQYREVKKDIIKEKRSIKIICPICGSQHNRDNTAQHRRSQKHIKKELVLNLYSEIFNDETLVK